jgi:hypothetical protein
MDASQTFHPLHNLSLPFAMTHGERAFLYDTRFSPVI